MADSTPIPNRAPSQCWALRRDNFYPVVFTGPDDTISISQRGESSADIVISRADARLLAKRINECLDATARR